MINDFVRDKTHDKIKKIVNGDELQSATIALVNVLYFNGIFILFVSKNIIYYVIMRLNNRIRDIDILMVLNLNLELLCLFLSY